MSAHCIGLSARLSLSVNASDVHSERIVQRGRAGGLLSYEGGEAWQRRSRARHVVHDDLAAVEADDSAALRLRVRVARVLANRPLSLPRLTQRVVHVRVMVHEGVRLRFYTLVITLRILETKMEC